MNNYLIARLISPACRSTSFFNQYSFFVEVRQESRQRLVTAWQNYCESGDDLDPNSPMKQRPVRLPSVDDDALPLPDGVLTTNIGLDIVVVVTKVRTPISFRFFCCC